MKRPFVSPFASSRAMRFFALVRKETLQVIRDPSQHHDRLRAAGDPALHLRLRRVAGCGLARASVWSTRTRRNCRQDLAASFIHSRYFDVTVGSDRRQFEDALVAGRIHGIVVIPPDFDRRLCRRRRPEHPGHRRRCRHQHGELRTELRRRRRQCVDGGAARRIRRRRRRRSTFNNGSGSTRNCQPQFPRAGLDRDRDDAGRHAFDVSGGRARVGARHDGGDAWRRR